jgi:hypothetical protein
MKDVNDMNLQEVVSELIKKDPNLEKNLKKLLLIATEKPIQYQSFANILNMFY